ncbi:hypothetical protein CDL15_Pgr017838 [Punica granatum]|uniref:Uncharacterized protein n=1 Tax=Punica granatum TaxID=22663 RepID=A0A218WGL0_PUNGR|nr:hypothetical protein CDL15_Pgr017838 [Punica granatum]
MAMVTAILSGTSPVSFSSSSSAPSPSPNCCTKPPQAPVATACLLRALTASAAEWSPLYGPTQMKLN